MVDSCGYRWFGYESHLICFLETRDPVFYILVTQPYLCDSRDLWRPG